MRIVYQAQTLIDAHLVKQALEAQEIPAFIAGEHLAGAMGELPALGLMHVLVPDQAWPEARAVVEQLLASLDSSALGDSDVVPDPAPA